jgi:hypothetical protein
MNGKSREKGSGSIGLFKNAIAEICAGPPFDFAKRQSDLHAPRAGADNCQIKFLGPSHC